MRAVVYADGSGTAARGPGGVGFVADVDGFVFEGSLGLPSATNQQAESLAAAYALAQIDPCAEVVVRSDSEYVVKGMSEWVAGWVALGWRTKSGSPVKNQPHWRRLLDAAARHDAVRFEWVRGHAGDERNERADELAGEARIAAIEEAEGMAAW